MPDFGNSWDPLSTPETNELGPGDIATVTQDRYERIPYHK